LGCTNQYRERKRSQGGRGEGNGEDAVLKRRHRGSGLAFRARSGRGLPWRRRVAPSKLLGVSRSLLVGGDSSRRHRPSKLLGVSRSQYRALGTIPRAQNAKQFRRCLHYKSAKRQTVSTVPPCNSATSVVRRLLIAAPAVPPVAARARPGGRTPGGRSPW